MKILFIFSLLISLKLLANCSDTESDGTFTIKDLDTKSSDSSVSVYKNEDGKSGKLSTGQEVKLVCIKKGLIGMPNVATPDYLGVYTAKNGDKCYVFAKN